MGAIAAVAAAGVGAAASIGGALLSSSAAKSAAGTQANAANTASKRALAQYQQTRTDLLPYQQGGVSALAQLQSILGLNGGYAQAGAPQLPAGDTIQSVAPTLQQRGLAALGLQGPPQALELVGPDGKTIQTFAPGTTQSQIMAQFGTATGGPGSGGANPLSAYGLSGLTFQPTQAALEATPGYQFDLSQGLQSVQNSNAAQGLGISGAALKGAANYATGLANNTLTTQQGIFQQNLGNVLNPLQYLSNQGENAAATTGQQGVAATANANAASIGGANALAAGQVGSANALAGGLSGLGSSGLNYLLYSQLLNGGSGGGGGGGSSADNVLNFSGGSGSFFPAPVG